jgi:aspartyl-tRNA(Asn)/glutamyl-tRNA(Gln) amidotransferase subunit A
LVSYASSLDQVGALGRTVEDCALLLNAICGHDPLDSTSAEVPTPDFRRAFKKGLAGLRIGLPKEYFVEGLDPLIQAKITDAVNLLAKQGARIVEVSLPHTRYAISTYYLIATAEASSNLARYDGVKYGFRTGEEVPDMVKMVEETRSEGFGKEVKRRIMLGTFVLSAGYYDAYYGQAQKVRTLVRRDFEQAFARVDLIVAPTTPGVAFKMGEKEDPLQMYLNDIFTIPVNLAGLPGVSIPGGFTQTGLPIGLQLIGRAFDEATLLRAAHAYQQVTAWHTRKPLLTA